MNEPTEGGQSPGASFARFERGSEGRGHQLILSRNGLIESFEVSLEACPSPVCGCPIVTLVCAPVDDRLPGNPGPHTVSLDVVFRCADSHTADAGRLDEEAALLVAAGLDSEQWTWLQSWLIEEKQRQMRDMDLDSLDIEFDPAVVAENALVGYGEVFPFAKQPAFETSSGRWVVEDQYCVQPGCRCTDCVLSFFPLPDDSGGTDTMQDWPRERHVEEEVAVRYDFSRRSWKMEPPLTLSLSATRQLVEALELARPNLPSLLATRRDQLRKLFKRALATSLRRASTASRPAPKIGRNELCPCGSGRKYKRCCGR